MGLSKFKQESLIVDQVFVDRHEIFSNLDVALHAFLRRPSSLQVIGYYGAGGIGKSRLLKEIALKISNSITDKKSVTLITSDLSSIDVMAPSDALYHIRQKADIPAALFDFALARLWTMEGRSIDQIKQRGALPEGLLVDLLEAAASAGSIFAPVTLINSLWKSGNEVFNRRFGRYKEKLDQIEKYSANELQERLPFYLGASFEEYAASAGCCFIFIFDGYEEMVRRFSILNAKSLPDAWLKELIGSAASGLFIIASRDILRWSESEPDWGEVLSQHVLKQLPVENARELLHAKGVDDSLIANQIIKLSGCVPLFIEICAHLYNVRKKEGKVTTIEHFSLARHEVVASYLSHLEKSHSEALKVCSVIRRFDLELLIALCHMLNIAFPLTDFSKLIGCVLIEQADDVTATYRVQRIIQQQILRSLSPVTVHAILTSTLHHASVVIVKGVSNRVFWILEDVVGCLNDQIITLTNEEKYKLVHLFLHIIEAGRWKLAYRLAASLSLGASSENLVNEIHFINGVSLRKLGNLPEAMARFSLVDQNREVLVGHQKHLLFYIAHTKHLQGHYSESIQSYKELSACQPVNIDMHCPELWARRQIADIKMLKGQFKEALLEFNSLLNVDNMGVLWIAETLRFKGHLMRFNFMFAEAEKCYLEAKSITEKNGLVAMQAKVLVNMVETLAWKSPEQALALSEQAISFNRDVSSRIEIGKALAAKALAMALKGDFGNAIKIAGESQALQHKSGYASGELFALQARAFAYLGMQQTQRATRVIQAMQIASEKTGVYKFLATPAIMFLGQLKHNDLAKSFQWIDANRTMEAISAVFQYSRSSKIQNIKK